MGARAERVGLSFFIGAEGRSRSPARGEVGPDHLGCIAGHRLFAGQADVAQPGQIVVGEDTTSSSSGAGCRSEVDLEDLPTHRTLLVDLEHSADPGHRRPSRDELEGLIKALENRDGAGARRLTQQHLDRVGREVTDLAQLRAGDRGGCLRGGDFSRKLYGRCREGAHWPR